MPSVVGPQSPENGIVRRSTGLQCQNLEARNPLKVAQVFCQDRIALFDGGRGNEQVVELNGSTFPFAASSPSICSTR